MENDNFDLHQLGMRVNEIISQVENMDVQNTSGISDVDQKITGCIRPWIQTNQMPNTKKKTQYTQLTISDFKSLGQLQRVLLTKSYEPHCPSIQKLKEVLVQGRHQFLSRVDCSLIAVKGTRLEVSDTKVKQMESNQIWESFEHWLEQDSSWSEIMLAPSLVLTRSQLQKICQEKEKRQLSLMQLLNDVLNINEGKEDPSQAVAVLLKMGVNCDSFFDFLPPLITTAKFGQLKSLELLVNSGAMVDIQENNGPTPLMYAAYYGHLECFKFLLENKADIYKQDVNGFTVLQNAVCGESIEVLKIILKKGVDINKQNKYGTTALMYAGNKKEVDIFKLLLENNADIYKLDKDGVTVFHRVVLDKNIEALKLLLERKVDVNLEDKSGRTALMCAANRGFFDGFKLLIDNYADIHKCDKDKTTVLHHAVMGGGLIPLIFYWKKM